MFKLVKQQVSSWIIPFIGSCNSPLTRLKCRRRPKHWLVRIIYYLCNDANTNYLTIPKKVSCQNMTILFALLKKNRIPNYKSLLLYYFILTFYFNYKKQIMFSKITLMIGFMLLSTGALQAQDKPELEIGGAVRFNYNLSS
jgi:hypothetical protein